MTLTKAEKVKWLITIGITAVLFFIPTGEIYTTGIKNFIAITIGSLLIMGLELLPTVVIAFLMPALWAVFNVAPMNVITSSWSNSILYMIIGAFILAATLEECGLLKRLACYIMIKVGDNYLYLLLGIFFSGVLITIVTFGSGYIILAALCIGLCRSLNIMGTRTAAAIGMSCMLGTITAKAFTYPASSYGLFVGLAQTVFPDFNVSFLQAMVANWPGIIPCLITIFIISKWYKLDVNLESRGYFEKELAELGPMKKSEIANLIVALLIIIFVCTGPLHHINTDYGFMILPWLLFVPGIDGATPKAIKNANIEIVFFVSACFAIGTVATHLGIGNLIAQYLLPLVGDNVTSVTLMAFLFVVIFVLNFLMTPLAIVSLILVPVMQLVMSCGLNPYPIFYSFMHSIELLLFPYEYVAYLVVFSFGFMKMADFIKFSAMRCIIYFAAFFALIVPYWNLIGIL